MNMEECSNRFCEYILFRFAWQSGYLEKSLPQNSFEYFDAFSRVYRYLLERMGYQILFCGITTCVERMLEPILQGQKMNYSQYHRLLEIYHQKQPVIILVIRNVQTEERRGINVFGNEFDACGFYISYGKYEETEPAWKACKLSAKRELCYRLKEAFPWKN